jgi:hypothetical protein
MQQNCFPLHTFYNLLAYKINIHTGADVCTCVCMEKHSLFHEHKLLIFDYTCNMTYLKSNDRTTFRELQIFK